MATDEQQIGALMNQPRFPRSAMYDAQWMIDHNMGPNAVWMTEALCDVMPIKPGMRVLDLGCGKALSSIFLAREFGAAVWATDLWISATDNWHRICEAKLEDRVFPIHAEAHSLPYADGFFDAVVSIDAYHYFGTDDLYLGGHLAKLVKPGGRIGIVIPGLTRDLPETLPRHLQPMWDPKECFSFHTAAWWRRHWEKTETVEIEVADVIEDGWRHWLDFEYAKKEAGAQRFDDEVGVLEADRGQYLGLIRMVAKRRSE
ncbi:MAG: methyltransferase domain-containing protein [Phycisphaerales bacterium]|nr:methyltransferase domain-containing protein [Phycisphaerales bacterium]